MRSIAIPVLSLLLLPFWGCWSLIHDIDVTITAGPSTSPHTRCYNHEMVEKGDIVVLHFNASYHETSPSGKGFITGSKEHSKEGSPLAVPVGNPLQNDGWDLALLGLCEDDYVTLTVPPEYVQGEAFAGKNVPTDAIVKIDVHIVDILVDTTDSDSDDLSSSDDSDDEDEHEL